MTPPSSSELGAANPAPQIALTINIDSILSQTQAAVVISSEVVDFMLDAMGKSDLSVKPSNPNGQYKFTSPPITADERRDNFENWLYLAGVYPIWSAVLLVPDETLRRGQTILLHSLVGHHVDVRFNFRERKWPLVFGKFRDVPAFGSERLQILGPRLAISGQ
jgi:hypothetical protein